MLYLGKKKKKNDIITYDATKMYAGRFLSLHSRRDYLVMKFSHLKVELKGVLSFSSLEE